MYNSSITMDNATPLSCTITAKNNKDLAYSNCSLLHDRFSNSSCLDVIHHYIIMTDSFKHYFQQVAQSHQANAKAASRQSQDYPDMQYPSHF